MITVISPAKSLDFETPSPVKQSSEASLLEQSSILIQRLKTLAPHDIAKLMKLSDKLALLNFDRFQAFELPLTVGNSKQAIFAFTGDVYQGLDANSLTQNDIEYAQQHLRILSGLYGWLKPLDLIAPYRLEMGTKLINSRGKDLYAFWDNKLNQIASQELEQQASSCLVNLASNEYAKALQLKKLKSLVVSPVFKDWSEGQYKIISFYAKRARGLMTRFIVTNKIEQHHDLLDFNLDGYHYDAKQSTTTEPVFIRKVG